MPEITAEEKINTTVRFLKPLIDACLPAFNDFKVKMDIVEHKIRIELIHKETIQSNRSFSVPTEMPLKDFVDLLFGG